MSHPPEPPLVANKRSGAVQWHAVAKTADRHAAGSHAAIMYVARQLPAGGQTLILGTGACRELPIGELAGQFVQVWLNDLEPTAPQTAITSLRLSPEARGRIEFDIRDITGVTEDFVAEVETILARRIDRDETIAALIGLANSTLPRPFAADGKFDLIVASCVLSQLHVAALNLAMERYRDHFTRLGDNDALAALRASAAWSEAIQALAARMEAQFIDDLESLIAPAGRIYFADTVQMCYLHGTPEGGWKSDGIYRMTRTTDLADYVRQRFQCEQLGQWPWVIDAPAQAGQVGRLYRVQALGLAPRATD